MLHDLVVNVYRTILCFELKNTASNPDLINSPHEPTAKLRSKPPSVCGILSETPAISETEDSSILKPAKVLFKQEEFPFI